MDEHDDRLGETHDESFEASLPDCPAGGKCEGDCEPACREFEVVDHSEADAIQVPDNLQKFDEFGAPIRPVVKVRDGVQDSEQHRGRRA